MPLIQRLLLLLFLSLLAHAADRPNVLFLICDDLNCDMGVYKHPQVKTPHVDRLAARGVTFDRAYCQYPLCGPSRASFMTGLYPDQTLIHGNSNYIRERLPSVVTIPMAFRNHGYFATRIGKLYHYNVPKHIGTGGHDDPYSWNQTINPRGRDVIDEPIIKTLRPGTFGATLSWLAAKGSDEEQTDGIAATHAIRLLEQSAKDKIPFYLAVGLYRPHTPYVAPKKYFDMYPLDSITVPEIPDGYGEDLPKSALKSIRRKKEQINLDKSIAREVIQSYYASITFADAQVGRILEALKRTGLEDNTIVVFTSDHGYHMGEHGHWQKTTLFENATRVPLVIAGPGVDAKGTVATAPVELVDLYPTLTALAGIATPSHAAGISLQPRLADASAVPRKTALSQYSNGYSLRGLRFRYTEWGEQGADGIELYDHQNDPGEMQNLAKSPEHAATIKQMRIQLTQRIAKAMEVPKGLKRVEEYTPRRFPYSRQFAPK
ncbi:MAG: iduronate 2-sulfatase [Rhodothermales bacterium]|jgi:iduronate 2-sulfatase